MDMEKRDFNKAAATWDENPGRLKMANNIANMILDAVKLSSDMKVLDFGCGTGTLALRLQPYVSSIMAVDSSAGMLEVLDQKIESQNITNVATQHLDIEQGDVLEGCYDLIVSSMTLHHVREPRLLIEQFSKIAAPHGYLCIADLDPDNGLFHGKHNEGVFHFGFDREAMRRILKDAGFDNIEYLTAAEIVRSIPGGVRPFTIFLVTGQKKI
ncbi:MAG: class I SAM-dependent methyltransferase [Syntrophomonadaceae bacterium]|nr:class I SAM-dependent methyltransferase [Syntrophomonadaceae bacterium]MDD3023349.1 class I SAM-dependent methyltransferase [Syntrophomonadaceae bacterium]